MSFALPAHDPLPLPLAPFEWDSILHRVGLHFDRPLAAALLPANVIRYNDSGGHQWGNTAQAIVSTADPTLAMQDLGVAGSHDNTTQYSATPAVLTGTTGEPVAAFSGVDTQPP